MNGQRVLLLCSGEESSLREGFFSRRSNLTTIANSVRFKIASCLAMTTFLIRTVIDSLSKDLLILFKVFDTSPCSVQA